MIPAPADVVLRMPEAELASRPNPPRRPRVPFSPTVRPVELPELGTTREWDKYLVRTAIVRSQSYVEGDAPVIDSARVVVALLSHLVHQDVESFVVISCDTKMRLVAIHETMGSIAGVSVELRQCLKIPFLTGSQRVFITHNHPSGDPTPSAEDISLTYALHKGCKCVGVDLVDHVVLGSGGRHFSFYDHSAGPWATAESTRARAAEAR